MVMNLPTITGEAGLTPGLGRSPGEGNDNALQYSCLGNPIDRGDWQATVQRVAKSWMPLRELLKSSNLLSFAC